MNILLIEDGSATLHLGNYSDLVERFKREAQVVAAKRAPVRVQEKAERIAREAGHDDRPMALRD